MPVHSRRHIINNTTQHLSAIPHAVEVWRRRHTATAQGMYQGACLVHARVQLVLYNQQQNTTFISTHAYNRGDDTRDTLQLHKVCTKTRGSSMPVHSWRHIINNRTLHLSAVTHAAEATTQETHYSCTRHVPRHVPRPCPCTTGII